MIEGQGYCGSGVHAAKAHGRSLRKGRVSEPGRIYLVTTTTHNRQRFFDDFHLGRMVVGAMRHQDHALRKDEDLVHLARYVVANPVRAGLVERLGDYPLWDAQWV